LIDIAVISWLAGFAEELLFRGVLQAKFGIAIASIVFGLVHCVTPAYIVVATAIGLFIGLVYHASGSLLLVIQLHAVYDFAALVYLKYFGRELNDNDGEHAG
jgi:hypothetical protein